MRALDRLLDRLFPTPPPARSIEPASRAPGAEEPDDDLDPDPEAPISGGAARPPGMSVEAHVERQIEEAQRRGRFDNLPLRGKPLPDLDANDPAWWIRRKLRDEGIEMPLPPALELKRDLPRELERIAAIGDDVVARQELLRLNERIRRVNSRLAQGPASTVAPIDVDELLARRRTRG